MSSRSAENRTGKPVDHKPDIRDAIGVFLTHLERSELPPVAKVLLYGSHARGEAHPESDIDLAVVLAGDAPPRSERSELRWKLSYLSADAILEILQPLSAVLLWESMLDEPYKTHSWGFYHNVQTDGVDVTFLHAGQGSDK